MAAAAQTQTHPGRPSTNTQSRALAPRVEVQISPDTLRAALLELRSQRDEINLHMQEFEFALKRWDDSRGGGQNAGGGITTVAPVKRRGRGRQSAAQKAALEKARQARHPHIKTKGKTAGATA
jgi:hypothetical protein